MELTKVKNSGWMRDRLFDLREYATHTRRFPLEFFRAWCEQHNKPKPSSPNAWGPFAGYAVGQGVIEPTDSLTPAASKRTHAHRVMIYESRVELEPVPFAGYV
jgi:hypothetical protein